MNKRFYPDSEKDPKPGLEKHHRLVVSPNPLKADQETTHTRGSIPNNWIYGESQAQKVWDDLETVQKKEMSSSRSEIVSPYSKIDESTNKIRNAITNFEVQDQEFLMELMDLLGEDTFIDSLDQSSILMEARYRLQSMIDEHIDFSDKQASLLSSILGWFADIKKKKKENEIAESNPDFMLDSFDVETLRKLLEEYTHNTEGSIERAEVLHQDIVQNLNSRVNECQKLISQKELQLDQLQQNMTQPFRRRTSNRGIANIRDSPGFDAELANSQRKVIELQQQVQKLRAALTEYSKINPDSQQTLEGIEQYAFKTPMSPSDMSTPSQGTSAMLTSRSIENGSPISLERELEFESRLRVLSEQVANFKFENKTMREQMMKGKQNELTLEKKVQTLEQLKKTTETSLQTATKKLETIETKYQQQIADLKKEIATIQSNQVPQESSIDIMKKYEKKIADQAEEFRKQNLANQESLEKRFRLQLNDVVKNCDKGDVVKALDDTIQQYTNQINSIRDDYEMKLKEMKSDKTNQLMEMSRHYEVLLKKKDLEIERVRTSVDNEVRNRMLDVRIEYDEKMNIQMLNKNSETEQMISKIKYDLTGRIDDLKKQLSEMTSQRNTLRALVETNDLAADVMDEFAEDSIEQEEMKQVEDDVLAQSLAALKEKELEQKLTTKYSLLMKTQKEIMADSKNWEVEQAKEYFKKQFEEKLAVFRESVAIKIQDIHDQFPNLDPILEKLLMDTLEIVESNDPDKTMKKLSTPMIPLSEIDKKMNDMREQIVNLLNENEMWKLTFDNLKGDLAGKSGEDILNALHSAITDKAQEFSKMAKENEEMKKEVEQIKLSRSSSKLVLSNTVSQINSETSLPILQPIVLLGLMVSFEFEIPGLYDPELHKDSAIELSKSQEYFLTHDVVADDPPEPQVEPIVEEQAEVVVEEIVEVKPEDSPPMETPEQIKLRKKLEKTKEKNSELVNKLQMTEKHMKDIEFQYVRKISQLSDEITTLQQQMVKDSMKLIDDARNLSEDPENLQPKIDTTLTIAQSVQDMEITNTETQRAARKLNKLTTKLKKTRSFTMANSALDATHEVLRMISQDSMNISENKMTKIKEFKSLRVAHTSANFLAKEIVITREMFEDMVAHHKEMVDKLKEATLKAVHMTKAVKHETVKTIDDLNIIIEQRNQVLTNQDETIKQQELQIEDITENLRATVAELKRLKIQKNLESDEKEVKQHVKIDEEVHINTLTREVIDSRNEARKSRKQLEDMKLLIQEIDNERLVNSARSGTTSTKSLPRVDSNTYELDLVAPFVVYTNAPKIKTPRKGFALLPRNTIVFEKKEINIETNIPAPPSSATSTGSVAMPVLSFSTPEVMLHASPPVELEEKEVSELPPLVPETEEEKVNLEIENEATSVFETKQDVIQRPEVATSPMPSSPKGTKLRVTYNKSVNKSGARVIVPKSKSSIQKTPRKTPITPASTPCESSTSVSLTPSPPMTRSLSFEQLMPLSEDDTTGSIIAYVTHYMKDLTKEQVQKKPRLLSPNRVYVSDVPLDKLRIEPQNLEPHFTNRDPPPDWLVRVEKRFKLLENQIREKTNAIEDEKDKAHRALQAAYKMKNDLLKSQREEKKAKLLLTATKKRLSEALHLVTQSDQEVAGLKRILKELGAIANSIHARTHHGKVNKKLMSNRIDKVYQSETETILSVLKAQNGETTMAKHEIDSLRKWIPKRDNYLKKEREKLTATLEAMQLIHSEEQFQGALTINSIRKKDQSPEKVSRPITPKNNQEKAPTVEKAVTFASTVNPKLPRNLTRGVVGSKLKPK